MPALVTFFGASVSAENTLCTRWALAHRLAHRSGNVAELRSTGTRIGTRRYGRRTGRTASIDFVPFITTVVATCRHGHTVGTGFRIAFETGRKAQLPYRLIVRIRIVPLQGVRNEMPMRIGPRYFDRSILHDAVHFKGMTIDFASIRETYLRHFVFATDPIWHPVSAWRSRDVPAAEEYLEHTDLRIHGHSKE